MTLGSGRTRTSSEMQLCREGNRSQVDIAAAITVSFKVQFTGRTGENGGKRGQGKTGSETSLPMVQGEDRNAPVVGAGAYIIYNHKMGARPSTGQKHQAGKARQKGDLQGRKDPPRKRPSWWPKEGGSWPPSPDDWKKWGGAS